MFAISKGSVYVSIQKFAQAPTKMTKKEIQSRQTSIIVLNINKKSMSAPSKNKKKAGKKPRGRRRSLQVLSDSLTSDDIFSSQHLPLKKDMSVSIKVEPNGSIFEDDNNKVYL